ncbi:ATP-binding response regulator [Halohasta salina]|uniref:ATP-binding response regulator n=1 Tax=Halohasta salina TaxID=2961621 RepID=UPI0020A44AC1|nr:hybrid sensor histidine kinase/response regulator [Halohasta salina]
MTVGADGELRVLLIEDNPGDATLFERYLTTTRSGSFPPSTVVTVESLDEAIVALEDDAFDLVVLDLGLPASTGLDTLDRYSDAIAAAEGIDPVPVIVLTGLEDDDTAVEAIERGAQDYLVKDTVDGPLLRRTIRYALERHAQQQALRRQNARLERFANVVSHDLRNPLSVAQGRIEMIDSDHAAVIERNLDRMEAIIEDVLTLAREGETVEETDIVDLAALAAECWESVSTDDATLSVTDGLRIRADRSRCRQLLENLFRNSVEHGSVEGSGVSIHVGGLEDGFYVADDGPGIPEDDRDSVFDPGYSTSEDGTGLGLNIAREIAEAHGWHVAVTTGTDGGARFEFTGVDTDEAAASDA